VEGDGEARAVELGKLRLELADTPAAEEVLARAGDECAETALVENVHDRPPLRLSDHGVRRKCGRADLPASEQREFAHDILLMASERPARPADPRVASGRRRRGWRRERAGTPRRTRDTPARSRRRRG